MTRFILVLSVTLLSLNTYAKDCTFTTAAGTTHIITIEQPYSKTNSISGSLNSTEEALFMLEQFKQQGLCTQILPLTCEIESYRGELFTIVNKQHLTGLFSDNVTSGMKSAEFAVITLAKLQQAKICR
jgi:hypothetical protein